MPEYVSVAFNLPLRRVFTYRNPDGKTVEPGCRVEAVFGRRKLTGWVTALNPVLDIEAEKVKEWLRVVDKEPLFGTRTLDMATWLAGMYYCSLGEALSVMLPTGKRESGDFAGAFDTLEMADHPVQASTEQLAALERIMSAPSGSWYLYGPTGTGKTEVFLQAAEATLAEGRSVLYLVPEIALTHQVIDTVRRRFGARCAVLHSGLTPSRKLGEWKRIRAGEATVVVGARSAVFAPLARPGLIVLDEEHEGSYKSGTTPRYHCRQVAMWRAREEGARLLMGSATPSVEAWKQMQDGALPRLTLSRRLAGGTMPEVRVVDLRAEKNTLSDCLVQAVREVKATGGQSILFLNRRGFSYFWSCSSCGAELRCRQCSVGLTYHKEQKRLVCHYCGYSTVPPQSCPECGSLEIGASGFGTERIEEEAAALFPDFRIARLDSDTVRQKGVLEETLAAFRDRKLDLLLGTQMVAKGLNFPGVQLVGVILADTTLNLPDFRAAERAFSLITQVAGRAGRFAAGGRVIVQTYRPQVPVIRQAALHDLQGFYAEELKVRQVLGFPPYARLIRLVLRSRDDHGLEQAVSDLALRLGQMIQVLGLSAADIELLGPAECPIAKVAGNSRRQLLLRGTALAQLRRVLSAVLETWSAPQGCYCEIDVDPVSLM